MLKEGDRAPSFRLTSDQGDIVSLKSLLDGPLVVYFYPRDDTPGCTREAIAFSQALPRFAAVGAKVVGISKDSAASHCKFRDKYGLRLPLLADPDLTVHKAFGAYGEKTMYGRKVMGVIRSTFVVGANGRIMKVFPSVKVDGHADAVLAALGASGATAQEAPAKKSGKKAGPAKAGAPKRPTPAKTAPSKPASRSAAKRTARAKPR